VLWIRIDFSADPDLIPAFYLDVDPYPDPGAKPIQADPDPYPGKTLKSQKIECLHESIVLKEGNKSKKYLRKAGNQVYVSFLVNFTDPGSESGYAFPVRIRIRDSQINADPDLQHRKIVECFYGI
jgi:hypothetical protein